MDRIDRMDPIDGGCWFHTDLTKAITSIPSIRSILSIQSMKITMIQRFQGIQDLDIVRVEYPDLFLSDLERGIEP